jgi:putative acyl-CoA dehydrogenase
MNISQNALWLDNPGLKEFDISNYQGVQNRNFYHEDHLLQRIVKNILKNQPSEEKNAVINHLTGYGALVGGILNQLTFECHKEGKYGEIIHYDRSGNRIDKVQYSAEQIESRKISYEYRYCKFRFSFQLEISVHSHS